MSDNKDKKVPVHVAFILDGNGRWAKKRLLPRTAGHAAGSKNVEKVCEMAWDMGVKYVTMYAFSTENWKRPEDEVGALMKLLHTYVLDCMKKCKKNNMRVRFIGDLSMIAPELVAEIRELEEMSKIYTGLNLQIALNYGSRDEIRRGITKIAERVKAGEIEPSDIDEDMISASLDTSDIPDPDLMIRTSGEQRLSNYLLWQLAYAEFYFTDTYWPDFGKKELEDALSFYADRDRRFGNVGK